jgi:hypothetical protein
VSIADLEAQRDTRRAPPSQSTAPRRAAPPSAAARTERPAGDPYAAAAASSVASGSTGFTGQASTASTASYASRGAQGMAEHSTGIYGIESNQFRSVVRWLQGFLANHIFVEGYAHAQGLMHKKGTRPIDALIGLLSSITRELDYDSKMNAPMVDTFVASLRSYLVQHDPGAPSMNTLICTLGEAFVPPETLALLDQRTIVDIGRSSMCAVAQHTYDTVRRTVPLLQAIMEQNQAVPEGLYDMVGKFCLERRIEVSSMLARKTSSMAESEYSSVAAEVTKLHGLVAKLSRDLKKSRERGHALSSENRRLRAACGKLQIFAEESVAQQTELASEMSEIEERKNQMIDTLGRWKVSQDRAALDRRTSEAEASYVYAETVTPSEHARRREDRGDGLRPDDSASQVPPRSPPPPPKPKKSKAVVPTAKGQKGRKKKRDPVPPAGGSETSGTLTVNSVLDSMDASMYNRNNSSGDFEEFFGE